MGVLLASILAVAGCGLVYELLIATVSSYLLGSSVTQFSIAIGIFLGAMGLGSHLSQRVRESLLTVFLLAEITLGVLGGFSVALLFAAYAWGAVYEVVLYALLVAIGALVGLELPLLTRILRRFGALRVILARALALDYLGALVGSLLFPILLLPWLGMIRTAFAVGLANLGVALWNLRVFRAEIPAARPIFAVSCATTLLLSAGFAQSSRILASVESHLYDDEIVYAEQTPYQRIVLTRWRDDLRLYLDGNLQFASGDEYRYHEALVHPALSAVAVPRRVLVMGGGDGLAVREILKWPGVEAVVLVDLDERMTRIGREYPAVVALNVRALHDPRVRIVHADAYRFLETDSGIYDVVLADLPDPNHETLAKLYSREFYRLVTHRLARGGVFAGQATSPFAARDAFWCVVQSVRSAGLSVAPYHAHVPTFGEWGFFLSRIGSPVDPASLDLPIATKFLDTTTLPGMFVFGADEREVPVEVSTWDRPVVLDYYLRATRRWE